MIRFVNWFTKITAWPLQWFCFRTKIHYEDRSVQGRRFHGPAIVICNHTSIFDFAVLLFVFFGRTVRYQTAEVLFRKKILGPYLKMLGAIRVDRDTRDFSFLVKSEDILKRGGAVGIFPESRLPMAGEESPLPFKPSAAYLALSADVPVIPVYTNGSYFNKKRAKVIIGKPINVCEYTDSRLPERDNIERVSEALRNKIILLGKELEAYENKA